MFKRLKKTFIGGDRSARKKQHQCNSDTSSGEDSVSKAEIKAPLESSLTLNTSELSNTVLENIVEVFPTTATTCTNVESSVAVEKDNLSTFDNLLLDAKKQKPLLLSQRDSHDFLGSSYVVIDFKTDEHAVEQKTSSIFKEVALPTHSHISGIKTFVMADKYFSEATDTSDIAANKNSAITPCNKAPTDIYSIDCYSATDIAKLSSMNSNSSVTSKEMRNPLIKTAFNQTTSTNGSIGLASLATKEKTANPPSCFGGISNNLVNIKDNQQVSNMLQSKTTEICSKQLNITGSVEVPAFTPSPDTEDVTFCDALEDVKDINSTTTLACSNNEILLSVSQPMLATDTMSSGKTNPCLDSSINSCHDMSILAGMFSGLNLDTDEKQTDSRKIRLESDVYEATATSSVIPNSIVNPSNMYGDIPPEGSMNVHESLGDTNTSLTEFSKATYGDLGLSKNKHALQDSPFKPYQLTTPSSSSTTNNVENDISSFGSLKPCTESADNLITITRPNDEFIVIDRPTEQAACTTSNPMPILQSGSHANLNELVAEIATGTPQANNLVFSTILNETSGAGHWLAELPNKSDKTIKVEVEKLSLNVKKELSSNETVPMEFKSLLSTEQSTVNKQNTNIDQLDDEDIALAKGAYSFDFSKFDDPNFDPFKTNQAVANDSNISTKYFQAIDPLIVGNEENESSCNTSSFQSSDDLKTVYTSLMTNENLSSNLKISTPMKNNSDWLKYNSCSDQASSETVAQVESSTLDEMKVGEHVNTTFTNMSNNNLPSTTCHLSMINVSENKPTLPKGMYSLDFDKFDDSNFDPFKTTKGLSNEDNLPLSNITTGQTKDQKSTNDSVSLCQKEEESENLISGIKNLSKDTDCKQTEHSNLLVSLTSSNIENICDLNKGEKYAKSHKVGIETNTDQVGDDDFPLAKGAYSLDFSKFDDPNFDPFKTNQSITNDFDKLSGPPQTVDTSVVVANETLDSSCGLNKTSNDLIRIEASLLHESNATNEINAYLLSEGIPDGSYHPENAKDDKSEHIAYMDHAMSEAEAQVESPTLDHKNFDKVVDTTFTEKDGNVSSTSAILETKTFEDEPILPTGEYSIDFSKFDDPNFNPFKTNKGLISDEDLSMLPKSGSDRNFSNVNLLSAHGSSLTEKDCKETSLDASNMNSKQKIIAKDSTSKFAELTCKKPNSANEKSNDLGATNNSLETFHSSEAAISGGTYSSDLNKFDDLNFDPFKTTTELRNDEINFISPASKVVNQGNIEMFSQNELLVDQGKEQDDHINAKEVSLNVNLSPSKSSADGSLLACQVADSTEQMDVHNKELVRDSKKQVKTIKKPKQHSKVMNTLATAHNDNRNEKADEENVDIPIPKGTYSIDFSKFDDPNFNPFQTNTALSDDVSFKATEINEGHDRDPKPTESLPDSNEAINNVEVAKPVSVKKKALKPKKKFVTKSSSSKSTKQSNIKTSGLLGDSDQIGEDDLPLAKGAYSIDFSKFGDSNFDPFKSTTGLKNDETNSNSFKTNTSILKQGNNMNKDNDDMWMGQEMEQNAGDNENEVPLKAEDTSKECISKTKNIHSEEIVASNCSNTQMENTSKNSKQHSGVANVMVTDEIEDDIINEKNDEDIIIPKGAYSIDFSKFDDPNFNPFQTNETLGNDLSLNAAEMNKTLNCDSTTREPQLDSDQAIKVEVDKPVSVKKKAVKSRKKLVTKSSTLESTKQSKIRNSDVPADTDQVGDDGIPIAKGAYSIDFSKFDDPNFNPFQTNTTLNNGISFKATEINEGHDRDPKPAESLPDSNEAINNVEVQKPVSVKKKALKPKKKFVTKSSSSKSTKQSNIKTSGLLGDSDQIGDDDLPLAKGAYSFDFSKFDDPNFNPFQSNKTLDNEDVSQNTVTGKDDEKIHLSGKSQSYINQTAESEREKSVSMKKKILNPEEQILTKPSTMNSTKHASKDVLPADNNELNNDELPVPPVKGAYSIDFSKFDDPNFDPFKSTKALANGIGISEDPNPVITLDDVDDVVHSTSISCNSNEDSSSSSDTMVIGGETDIESAFNSPSKSPLKAKAQNNLKNISSITLNEKEIHEDDVQSTEVFYSPEEVFSGDGDLKTWDALWNKESKNENSATASDLHNQSLHVQFDPLVQPIGAVEKSIQQAVENILEPTDEKRSPRMNTALDETEGIREEMDATDISHLHPAAARLARNLSEEKWNESEAQKSASGENLITFSPLSGAKGDYERSITGKTTHSTVRSEIQSASPYTITITNLDESQQQKMRREEENKRLLMKKRMLLLKIKERKLRLEGNESTIAELEKNKVMLCSELDMAKQEQTRVLDDITSAKRVFYDYHMKANELLPVLKTHKKTDVDLRKHLKEKIETFEQHVKIYNSLKKEAENTKTKLSSEVAKSRAAVERDIAGLQAKCKREQMSINSLTSSLQEKERENEELTKICDELIAGVEHRS